MLHLVGRKLPAVALPSTGSAVEMPARMTGCTVIFCYPWTGRPGTPDPPGWDAIPGAHGSTPQALAYSSAHGQFRARAAAVFGLSLQDTGWQREFAFRCGLPFPLLSDESRQFSQALGLPTFETGGEDYLERLTLIARGGVIVGLRYPVVDPGRDSEETLALLASM
ncbi:MAG: peroxiredoxin [Hyphomicrobiales bacterium]